MDLGFRTTQLSKLCTDPSTRRRRLGPERAKKVQLRLDQIVAAASLEELCKLPQARCHQLSADRDEVFSLDLDGPYRLLIEIEPPIPRMPDGGIDRSRVENVTIVSIEDTH